MKKLVILLLAVLLAACSSAPTALPTEPPAPTVVEPTQTPVVIVQTVVVEATQPATVVPSPTAEPPTAVPATPTAIVVTVVVEATQPAQAAAPTSVPANATSGLITIDQALGAGWFTNITLTKNLLSLRCQINREITFTVKPLDANITQVDFYYRIVDRFTGSAFDWQNVGRMPPDANGNFVLVFAGDDVNANFRKPNAWLDFQFIGLSRSGGVVGRSEKIEQQVTYTFDCP
jgi:hypothetical protein